LDVALLPLGVRGGKGEKSHLSLSRTRREKEKGAASSLGKNLTIFFAHDLLEEKKK